MIYFTNAAERRSTMNLREQLYVCAIAKTGSLTAAAKILNTSQPNLSLFLSDLERSLNIKLFDRIGKQFRLCAVSEAVTDQAAEIALFLTFDGSHPVLLTPKGRLKTPCVSNLFLL